HGVVHDFHFAGRAQQCDESRNTVDDESRLLFLFRTPLEGLPEHRTCVGLWSGILRHQRNPLLSQDWCVSQASVLACRDRRLSARRDPDSAVAYNDDWPSWRGTERLIDRFLRVCSPATSPESW